jgi:hypothetical protein
VVRIHAFPREVSTTPSEVLATVFTTVSTTAFITSVLSVLPLRQQPEYRLTNDLREKAKGEEI